jgi:hypothetical protein
MKKIKIKKAGILAFAVIGGTMGGGVSLTGKMLKNKYLENLGEDMIDSALFTGELVGEAIGGVNDIIAGKIKKDNLRTNDGKESLKGFAKDSIHNVATNLSLIGEKSEEAIVSLIDNDKNKALEAAKTLGEVLIIGTLTMGAIKINPNK